MSQLFLLMQRDGHLLFARSWKRLLVAGIVLAGLVLKEMQGFHDEQQASIGDLFAVMAGGVTVEVIRDHALLFPYTWFFLLVLPVVISFDFVRADLFGGASHILAKSSRKIYWLSKCVVLVLMNCGICLGYLGIIAGFGYFMGLDDFSLERIVFVLAFLWLGMTISCLIFSLLSLFVREITGIMFTMILVCSGLRSTNLIFPTGHFMWIRHSEFTRFAISDSITVIYGICLLGIILIMGLIGIDRIDILTAKSEE
ncbi:hypothetical protein ACRW9N_03370 [Listeria aquatica]|uniref:hypothetical protein n=1 Tax=Listeria aquatica TaxID=1494960 RepID=UPI003EF3B2EC